MSLSSNFHKDPIFCCRDICKIILTFVQSSIFNVFAQIFKIQALQHINLWRSYKTCRKIFGNYWSKCPDIKRIRRPISLQRVPPGRSNKAKTYFSSVGSPCTQETRCISNLNQHLNYCFYAFKWAWKRTFENTILYLLLLNYSRVLEKIKEKHLYMMGLSCVKLRPAQANYPLAFG